MSIKDRRWFQRRLFRWFAMNRRDLPWRKTRDPYKILVSEIMLQQTQVDRVVPKYKAFLKEFPTVAALARVPASAVIRAWSGLGYNRRALYLQRAAQEVLHTYTATFPSDPTILEKLPGVGKYTAGAIAAFAFGQDAAPVDTNIRRVIHRWFYGVEFPKRKAHERAIEARARSVVPKGEGWIWNHAMMDFGALVCTAKRPKCARCPMQEHCRAYPKIMEVRSVKSEGRSARRVEAFVGSNRYWRGRIVDLLRHATGHSLPFSQSVALLGSGMTRQLLRSLILGLAKDRLVVLRRSRIALPK